jgi:hypothetical protein
MELVQPVVQSTSSHSSGCVLLGWSGDIWARTSSVAALLRLRCMTWGDAAGRFAASPRHPASFIGLSGLLTASYSAMRETVSLLQSAAEPGARPIPIIIGGQVDEQMSRYVGADYWVTDAMEGVRLCQRLVAGDNDRLAQAPMERQT